MLTITENNIIYKLGRNAKENFELIDDAQDANPEYWWFHLEDHPSGHCVIYAEEITNQMVSIAANLVKQYSKLKSNKKAKIVYTQIKNVKKTKTIGQVLLQGQTHLISI
jgi:predicted ribosome quality control (RQC) complex YloA/Tae2 family protein